MMEGNIHIIKALNSKTFFKIRDIVRELPTIPRHAQG